MGTAYQRGSVLYNQGRYAMACEEFRKELSQSPNNTLAMSMLALSLKYDKKYEEAIEQAKASVAIDPGRSFSHYALACVLVGPGLGLQRKTLWLYSPTLQTIKYRRKLRKARAPGTEAIRLSPRNPDYMAFMAAVEFDLGKNKKAINWAEQGLAIRADHLRCTQLRARCLARLGRANEARQTIKGALALAPENASIHAASGWTHLKTGDAQIALEHFSEAVRLNPNDQAVHTGLRQARRATSRTAKLTGSLGILCWAVYLLIRGITFTSSDKQNGAVGGFITFVVLASIAFLLIRRRWKRR